MKVKNLGGDRAQKVSKLNLGLVLKKAKRKFLKHDFNVDYTRIPRPNVCGATFRMKQRLDDDLKKRSKVDTTL